ncbi:MAG: GYD domain-containing protein [Candidatus Bathyarchaeota archaeon]
MPTYILVSKLTPEGRRTILEKPERIKEVNKEIEAFGAKVLQQYSLLGPYDFINVLEAPNNDIINKVSIILGSRGTIEIMSMPAMKIDDFISILKTRKRNRIKN